MGLFHSLLIFAALISSGLAADAAYQLSMNATAITQQLGNSSSGQLISKCSWAGGACSFSLPFSLSLPAATVDDASR
jgi:hypothetical protein